MSAGLTQKQLLFVESYLLLGNATEAAKAAGYSGNRETLGAMGGENLKKPGIRDAIEQRQAEIRERSTITLEEKRMKLWEIACKCEADDPAAAIKAIHEMNVMDGDIADTRSTVRVWSFEEMVKQMNG